MISFISASNGKLELKNRNFDHNTDLILASADVNELAESIRNVGLDESVLNSSSVDFASEYGFETNEAAWDLFYEAATLAGYGFDKE